MKKLQKIISLTLILVLMASIIPYHIFAEQTSIHADKRIAGNDRYETAVQISKQGWPQGAQTVVLARGDMFPDALAGAPLARKLNSPILLTNSKSLTNVTKEEITRLQSTKAVILGGTNSISQEIENTLKQMGLTIERLAGTDRYTTSVEIAKQLGSTKEQAIIATGANFPDALAIAPYAAEHNIPILLSAADHLPSQVTEFLNGYQNTIIVGGTQSIQIDVEQKLPNPTRISGNTRYETSMEIIKANYDKNQKIYVSTGANFADALTGAVLAAKENTAVLIVDNNNLDQDIPLLLAQKQVKEIKLFGGMNSVSDLTVTNLTNILPQISDSIGGGSLSETVEIADQEEITELDQALDNATIGTNETLNITIDPDGEMAKKQVNDIIFLL